MAPDRVHRLVRPLLAHPRVLPATALALRARTVRPAWRFAGRELAGRRALAFYTAREGGLRVGVRHGTGDVVTLGEVFHERDYDPPEEVAAVLGRAPRVLDLGANVGLFGAWALGRWPHADVAAYEPDPANAAVHARTIAANSLGERWRLTRAAAGAANATVAFASGEVALSHVLQPGEDRTSQTIEVPLHDVLPEVSGADLVKLDIEGGEWAILGDPRFAAAPPRALAMEYHADQAPGGDPRAEALRLLAAAGLTVRDIRRHATGEGMLWAWRS